MNSTSVCVDCVATKFEREKDWVDYFVLVLMPMLMLTFMLDILGKEWAAFVPDDCTNAVELLQDYFGCNELCITIPWRHPKRTLGRLGCSSISPRQKCL